MKTYVSIGTFFLLFTVALSGEVFLPQNSQESTHVVISPTAGLPGQETSLPIYLEAATGVEVCPNCPVFAPLAVEILLLGMTFLRDDSGASDADHGMGLASWPIASGDRLNSFFGVQAVQGTKSGADDGNHGTCTS